MTTFTLRNTALAATLSAITVFATACDAEPADEPFVDADETTEFRVVSHDNGYMMNGYMMKSARGAPEVPYALAARDVVKAR